MVMATVLGLGLNLLICCSRRLANLFLYYELLYFLVQGLVPYDYGDFMHFVNLSSVLIIYMTVAIKPGQSTVACTVCMLVCEFCQMPLIYRFQNEQKYYLNAVLYSLACFLSLTFASMIIV